MSRHALTPTTPTPCLIPAHYLTPDTLSYPQVVLYEAGTLGDGVTAEAGAFVAVGLRMTVHPLPVECLECCTPCLIVWTPEIGDEVCSDCLILGDHHGIVPSCYVEGVEA